MTTPDQTKKKIKEKVCKKKKMETTKKKSMKKNSPHYATSRKVV